MASIDIAGLSREERLRLLDQLWESLAAKPEALLLTDAQREELDRRLDDLEREGPLMSRSRAVPARCLTG
ncbi:MAG TPA: addiction module protein [Terriglobia bacterium]|nr:addiction module protein [Terriglobia bacterium]